MAPEQPEEGWYRDPVDPTRRRWWDGEQWTQILTRPMAELGPATTPTAAASPTPAASPGVTMGDGTTLPYATDARPQAKDDVSEPEKDEKSPRLSRVRVLQLLLALVAILATAAVVYSGRAEDPPPETADTTFEGPAITTPTTETTTTTTTEAPATTEPPTTTEPTIEEEPEVEPVDAPAFREAYDACQAILDDSSIGSGGLDYQTFRDIDAVSQDGITELRFEATNAYAVTDAYLCRTLFNEEDGSVMVGRLYLDLQNTIAG